MRGSALIGVVFIYRLDNKLLCGLTGVYVPALRITVACTTIPDGQVSFEAVIMHDIENAGALLPNNVAQQYIALQCGTHRPHCILLAHTGTNPQLHTRIGPLLTTKGVRRHTKL